MALDTTPTRCFLPCKAIRTPAHCFHLHLPTAMEGPPRETVQQKVKCCAKSKDIFKGIKIPKLSFRRAPSQPARTAMPVPSAQRESSKMGSNAGVGKPLCLHCWQGLLSGNQYPAGTKTENTTTPINNRGDLTKGSGVAATSECFRPKSLQRSMNRQTYSGCTV